MRGWNGGLGGVKGVHGGMYQVRGVRGVSWGVCSPMQGELVGSREQEGVMLVLGVCTHPVTSVVPYYPPPLPIQHSFTLRS